MEAKASMRIRFQVVPSLWFIWWLSWKNRYFEFVSLEFIFKNRKFVKTIWIFNNFGNWRNNINIWFFLFNFRSLKNLETRSEILIINLLEISKIQCLKNRGIPRSRLRRREESLYTVQATFQLRIEDDVAVSHILEERWPR